MFLYKVFKNGESKKREKRATKQKNKFTLTLFIYHCVQGKPIFWIK